MSDQGHRADEYFLPEQHKLCILRAARGIVQVSQAELARRIGRDRTWISRVETGEIIPSPTEQARIAEALGFPVNDLFPEEETE